MKCVNLKYVIARWENVQLTHYNPVLFIFTPWKYQVRKTKDFLMFSEGIDKQHEWVMS